MEEVVQDQNNTETATDSENERKEKIVTFDFKMVTFSLAGKDYAIDIMNVKEIAKGGRFTYVPNTAPFVLGVYNLRGEIIPIIDLRLFFNIETKARKTNEIENMIIVTVEEKVFGIVVDAIDKVVGIQKSTIQPPHPLFGDINIKFIYGIVESNDRLYVLLDIDRIFANKTRDGDVSATNVSLNYAKNLASRAKLEEKNTDDQNKKGDEDKTLADGDSKPDSAPAGSGEVLDAEEKLEDIDFSFIIEGLRNYKKFHTSDLNRAWVDSRFEKWTAERGRSNSQFANETDAESFLSGFVSRCTNQFWTDEFADSILDVLPDNIAKQIVVWNPGCGKGFESYSLACIFKKRYPDARIRIFAQDMDLLNVSNASLLSVPDQFASSWYSPYLTKTVTGSYTFCQDIKDIVMFEYHDVSHTNTVPASDLIFCRDTLSFLPKESQDMVIQDFEEKLKGNGILIIGDNESLSDRKNWLENMVGNICIYKKQ